MFLSFGKRSSKREYGILVDVGSGSVAVALVVSELEKSAPEILWSVRRRFPSVQDPMSEGAAHFVAVALRDCLREYIKAALPLQHGTRISRIQVGLSAPWSHTVTRAVRVHHDKAFALTPKLIGSIAQSATEKIKDLLKERGEDTSSFAILSNTALSIRANGYDVLEHEGKMVNEVVVTHLIDFASARVTNLVLDILERTFPEVPVSMHSFMHLFYAALCSMHVEARNACLVDVTNEATEFGVVSGGILSHVSFVNKGSVSIARAVGEKAKIPTEEALALLRDQNGALSKTKEKILIDTATAYETAVRGFLDECGGVLSVPKAIFLHGDSQTEDFFAKRISNALSRESGPPCMVHKVTSKLFNTIAGKDSALLLSAHVFHHKPYDCHWD